MRVSVVAWDRELAMEVGSQEPVLEIKRKLEQLLSVPVAGQVLSVCGWELLDGLDMEDYPIVRDGTKIDLMIKPFPNPFHQYHFTNKIQITVKLSSGQINLEVDGTDTVRSLKEKIHIVDGTHIKRMSLFFSGVELQDDYRNLSECGVSAFSEIVVFLKATNRMRDEPLIRRLRISVQTSSSLLNAAVIPIEMKDSSTVNDLRQLLLSRKILPEDEYLFIHKQRIMRDCCSLRWHGVANGDSLYVFKGTVSRSAY